MNEVSLYPKITELVKGERIPFHEIMARIKGPTWSDAVGQLRAKAAAGVPKKELADIKATLPYFTGSGVFSKREDKGLIEHSGKIIIDFDNLMDITAARQILEADKYTEYLFKSCSGGGLAVVVNIEPGRHLDSFLFLEDYYKRTYNLTIDKACKDVSRPRYISYDPELYAATYFENVKLIDNSITVDTDDGRFDFALRLHDKKHAYVEGNRHNYLVILAYWLNKCGVPEGYALGQLVARFTNAEKTAEEITKIVGYCYKATHDFGTFAITKSVKDMPPEQAAAIRAVSAFAHGVNEAGRQWTELDIQSQSAAHYLNAEVVRGIFKSIFENNKEYFNLDNKSEIYKIELFIKKRYEILRNVVTQRTEYRPAGTLQPFEVLNSNTIFRDIQLADLKFTLDKLKSLLRSNFVADYNPFDDYFARLAPWDEEYDYIDYLADHITTDNQPFWKEQFKKSLVRSIACAIGGRENRIVMTLVEANQNTGKTSFIRFLCPPELCNYYTELPMDNNKDTELQLSENFIWNLEELAVLQNNEINKLKAIISRAVVKQRRAYAEYHESHPRRVNFWASTNRVDFLTDDQNTRWLCFNVSAINHDYNNVVTGVKNVDIDKVWAQAYHLYKSGYNYNLTKQEAEIRDSGNKYFEMATIEKNIIQKYFTPAKAGEGEFMTSTDMLMKIIQLTDNKITSKISSVMVGRCMRQLGYIAAQQRLDNMPQRGYWVHERATGDLETQFGATMPGDEKIF